MPVRNASFGNSAERIGRVCDASWCNVLPTTANGRMASHHSCDCARSLGLAPPSMDRCQQIESLFTAAVKQPSSKRDAWLRHSCAGDSGLYRAVASLLAHDVQWTTEGDWVADAAAQFVASAPPGLHKDAESHLEPFGAPQSAPSSTAVIASISALPSAENYRGPGV